VSSRILPKTFVKSAHGKRFEEMSFSALGAG
jgi:hypothetical protein